MAAHVIVDRDALDTVVALTSIASLVLAGVATWIALRAQASVREERRRASELETCWRVLRTFNGWQGSQEHQQAVLRGLLRTLGPDDGEDFPLIRTWVRPGPGVVPDNRATEDAAEQEYADAVERRLR